MPKRTTLKDVAQRAGVSYQTVSKLLNHEIHLARDTEVRIWQAVHDLEYHPNYTARSLRSQLSRTIGYSWLPTTPDHTNQILDTLLQSMFHSAEEKDYYLLCFPWHADTQRRLESYAELIDSGRVDGFILSSIEYDDPRVLYLLERDFPFVAFGRSNPELSFPCIDVDGGHGLRLATQHLLAQGHRNIAALAWPENSRVGNNRLEGYLAAMREAGIQPRPEWIMRGEGAVAFGRQAVLEVLNLPEAIRPSGVVAVNDMMATGAIMAARESGLEVGRQLAVTGFDDTPIAPYLTPPLTSLRQPVWEIGRQLIAMLLECLSTGGLDRPGCTLLLPELVVRASSLREPAHGTV